MVFMIFIVLLFSILLGSVSAGVLYKFPRDARDVVGFLVILALCVVVVLVFMMKGF